MNPDNAEPISAIFETVQGRVGRPSKYEPETVERLLGALADGLTQKQACLAAGIGETTLGTWREKYPELETRMSEARENARRKALAGIKAAGEAGDWRAWESFLRMSFAADYRKESNTSVEVNQTVQQAVVCNEKRRAELIEQRRRLFEGTQEEGQQK
jgi:hypothetical protein